MFGYSMSDILDQIPDWILIVPASRYLYAPSKSHLLWHLDIRVVVPSLSTRYRYRKHQAFADPAQMPIPRGFLCELHSPSSDL